LKLELSLREAKLLLTHLEGAPPESALLVLLKRLRRLLAAWK
jgi:hypothetical protein